MGKTWRWSKRSEFLGVVDLPTAAALPLELALGSIQGPDLDELHKHGWRTSSATDLNHPLAYRDYIRSSVGEFTVAKEQYVLPRTGWLSDRSVCYLAARRPVITQDTGFSGHIPTGEGLFAFRTKDEAIAAIDAVATDYRRHSRAAAELARECFDARAVLGTMLAGVGLL